MKLRLGERHKPTTFSLFSKHPRIASALGALGVLLALGAWWLTSWSQQPDPGAFQLRVAPSKSRDDFSLALYQSLGVRLAEGHGVKLVPNGEVFDALVQQISGAQSSMNIAMYIWEKGAASDRVVGALVPRAKAGVRCRILVDDVGSPDFLKTVAPALLHAGCEVRVFRPTSGEHKLARSHRKLVIVDGTTAITGGFGIRDTWLGDGIHAESWRDTNVVFTGPAVTDAQQAFAENWQEAGGGLLSAAAFPGLGLTQPVTLAAPVNSTTAAFVASSQGVVTRAERLIQLLIASAQRRLWIANAYFVPSEGILELIKQKARAGVDVRVLAPYKNGDSKTAFGAQHMEYGDLMKQGVKVWEYTSSMMHAKTMLIDDELALVGSINLDPLSLHELEENALLVRDESFARQLGRMFSADCSRSKALVK